MAVVIDINKTEEYILEREKNKEKPTIFILGVIDAKTKAAIRDKCTRMRISNNSLNNEEAWTHFNINQASYLYAEHGIKDIKNLVNEAGESVEFDKKVIQYWPNEDDILELGQAVKKFNTFSEEEVKN